MRNLAIFMAALGAATVLSGAPAGAAMGQCFDGYGRPIGGPYDTDNPPYGQICAAFRRGGSCTGVTASWAESNCGFRPRYYYRDKDRDYRDRDRRYRRYN